MMISPSISTPLDNQQRRIFRLVFALTASSMLAIAFPWSFSYMAPVLVVNIFSASSARPTLKNVLSILLVIVIGLFGTTLLSAFFIDKPVLISLILLIIFYWVYYFSNVGIISKFAATILIIGITVIPLMSEFDNTLASNYSQSFFMATLAALALGLFSHFLFPHLPEKHDTNINTTLVNFKSKAQGRRIAFISTLVVMPAMIFFLSFNLLNSALIIAFIAILSLNPALDEGKKAGIGLLLANVLGGILAFLFYQIMKTAPYYFFYLLLLSVFLLLIVRHVYSGKKFAPIWGIALTTFLLLTGPIFTTQGSEASADFISRFLQIFAAAVYIVMAFRLTATLWPKDEVNQMGASTTSNHS